MKQVVIGKKKQTVDLGQVDPNKIYAFKHGEWAYKLAHREGTYFFDFLGDTETTSVDYVSTSMLKSIEPALVKFDVYEFDNLKEFAEWLVKETK